MATETLERPSKQRKGSGLRRRALRSSLVLVIILAFGSLLALTPLIYMVSTSLKSQGETVTRVSAIPFDPRFWPTSFQWQNYAEAWRTANFGIYFRNSVVISVTTVAGMLAVSSLAAYAFAKLRFSGRDLIFSLILATLIIPETVLLIPNFLIVSKFGWVDRLLALTVPFMGSAFFIFLLRQFFAQIPDELIEVSTMDGCSHLRILLSVVLPLSKAPLFTVTFLGFIGAWNALQWPLVVTQTPRWRPIAVGLTIFISEAGPQTHLRMAGAVIAIVPVIALFFVAQKQFTEAIARTGLKG